MLHISQVPAVFTACICGRSAVPLVNAYATPGVSIWHVRTRQWQSSSADSRPVHRPAGGPGRSLVSHAFQAGQPASSLLSSRQPCRRTRVRVAASGSGGGNNDRDSGAAPLLPERWKLYAALIAVATVAATFLTYGGDSIQVQCLSTIPLHQITIVKNGPYKPCMGILASSASCRLQSMKAGDHL
jgi:hypothetical protein